MLGCDRRERPVVERPTHHDGLQPDVGPPNIETDDLLIGPSTQHEAVDRSAERFPAIVATFGVVLEPVDAVIEPSDEAVGSGCDVDDSLWSAHEAARN